MTLISVIIPVYNVKAYVAQSIESVLNQTYPHLEIILINDGSTDGSGGLCDEIAKKDRRISVIHKSNGGLSDARNRGTEVAQGDYIYYLDSDDWLAPNAIEELYDFAIQSKADVVQGGFYYAYKDRLLYEDSWIKKDDSNFLLDKCEAMDQLILNNYLKNFAWGKLYKAFLVKEHIFRKGVNFEDSFWKHLIIHEVSLYGVIPMPLYYYRQRNESISGNFSIKNLDLLKGLEERLWFIEENYPKLSRSMYLSFYKTILTYSLVARNQSKEIRDVYFKEKKSLLLKYKKQFELVNRDPFDSYKLWLFDKHFQLFYYNNLLERVYKKFKKKILKVEILNNGI